MAALQQLRGYSAAGAASMSRTVSEGGILQTGMAGFDTMRDVPGSSRFLDSQGVGLDSNPDITQGAAHGGPVGMNVSTNPLAMSPPQAYDAPAPRSGDVTGSWPNFAPASSTSQGPSAYAGYGTAPVSGLLGSGPGVREGSSHGAGMAKGIERYRQLRKAPILIMDPVGPSEAQAAQFTVGPRAPVPCYPCPCHVCAHDDHGTAAQPAMIRLACSIMPTTTIVRHSCSCADRYLFPDHRSLRTFWCSRPTLLCWQTCGG